MRDNSVVRDNSKIVVVGVLWYVGGGCWEVVGRMC